MKNSFRITALCSLVALSLPVGASAFTSHDGIRVNPVKVGTFEVVPRAGGLGRSYWCGAGDYAHRALKADWDAPLYIVRERGRSETTNRRSAVQFSLKAPAAGSGGTYGTVNSLDVGDRMTVSQAFGYCHELQIGF